MENYLKKTYQTHRQCSVAEAAYRLGGGMNLKGSNVKNIFVSTGYPENRSHFYRKVMDEDDHDLDIDSDSEHEENRKSQICDLKLCSKGWNLPLGRIYFSNAGFHRALRVTLNVGILVRNKDHYQSTIFFLRS